MTATITALREHPRRPGRYEVELAWPRHATDHSAPAKLPVSLELIAELKLKPGRTLDAPELARLQAVARAVACYDKALATLGARARSAADLARYLRTKEFTDVEIGPAIEKLTALGLLDDTAFARGFARSRLAPSRGYGPRRVAAELSRKGVSRAVINEVLAEHEAERAAHADGDAPRDAVLEVAQRKLRSMTTLEPEVRRRRLYGFLARRGFTNADIARAMRLIGR